MTAASASVHTLLSISPGIHCPLGPPILISGLTDPQKFILLFCDISDTFWEAHVAVLGAYFFLVLHLEALLLGLGRLSSIGDRTPVGFVLLYPSGCSNISELQLFPEIWTVMSFPRVLHPRA